MNNGLENLVDDYLQKEEQDFAEEWMWVAGLRKDLSQFSTKLHFPLGFQAELSSK